VLSTTHRSAHRTEREQDRADDEQDDSDASEQCWRMLRRGGTAVIVGMLAQGVTVELLGTDFIDEKSMTGCNMGSNRSAPTFPATSSYGNKGELTWTHSSATASTWTMSTPPTPPSGKGRSRVRSSSSTDRGSEGGDPVGCGYRGDVLCGGLMDGSVAPPHCRDDHVERRQPRR